MHVNSFVGVRGWQNGTRCRDGVRVLWCCSHLVWLVFEASISICACFHEGKLFVTCFCFFFFSLFVLSFRNGKTEGGRRGQGEDTWSTYLFIRMVINSNASK